MRAVTVKVSTRQQECFPGSVVEGNVEVRVDTKNNEESSADELKLRMVGLVKTCITYQTYNGSNQTTNTAIEEDEIISHTVELGAFGGKAASGVHNFPFSVTLPVDLPPSMKETSGSDSCSIQYSFEARLHRPGILHFDAKGSSVLRVLGTPQPDGDAAPVLAGPATQRVKAWCCFNRGSMSIGYRMDRSLVGPNDSIWLDVVASNNSTSTVNAMRSELKQETKWSARGHHATKTRTIVSSVVPGTDLGALQRAAGAGTERGQSVATVESNARQDLEQQLSSGTSTRVQLKVPADSLLTLQTPNISVSHSVGVVLETPSCYGKPAVWTPLHVQVGGSAAEVQPGGGSFVPTQASSQASTYPPPQTVPYSDASHGRYGSSQTVRFPNLKGGTRGAPPGS